MIVPVLPPAAELAAAPVPDMPAEPKVLPAGEPPPGEPVRRRNRGKRGKTGDTKKTRLGKNGKIEPVPPG